MQVNFSTNCCRCVGGAYIDGGDGESPNLINLVLAKLVMTPSLAVTVSNMANADEMSF